jgi:hypothetical protein
MTPRVEDVRGGRAAGASISPTRGSGCSRKQLLAAYRRAWKQRRYSLRWQREVKRLNLALLREELGLGTP